jgi:hypothetical protein
MGYSGSSKCGGYMQVVMTERKRSVKGGAGSEIQGAEYLNIGHALELR